MASDYDRDRLAVWRDPKYVIDGGIAPGHMEHGPTERRFTHDGHEVVIETHYRITIDGTEFKDHLTVDPNGSVHYHGLPQYSAPSAVDVMKAIVSRLSVGDRPAPLESGQPVHDGHGGH